MEGFLTSAGTKIRRNHQDCNHSSGCRRVWLMLPEMQRGRRAESAQAGSRSLQTQTRGDQTGPAGKVPGVCLMQAGTEPWCPGPGSTCAEREELEQERSPGHGAHRTLVRTVGWAVPGLLFSPRLSEEGLRCNWGHPRAHPGHP